VAQSRLLNYFLFLLVSSTDHKMRSLQRAVKGADGGFGKTNMRRMCWSRNTGGLNVRTPPLQGLVPAATIKGYLYGLPHMILGD